MHVLFIVLLVLSILGLIAATIKPGINKKTGKSFKRRDMLLGYGAFVVLFIILTAVTAPKAKLVASLSTLNDKSAQILATATNNTEKLMTTGQTVAAQKGALTTNPPSSFQQWRKTVQQTTDSNTDNAYNQATALYRNANEPIPVFLNNWKKDNFAAYSDIGIWQLMEVTVLVDNQGGSSSSSVKSDQSTLATDYNAYLGDVSKAIADIKKLSPNVTVNQPSQSSTSVTATSSGAPSPSVSVATLNSQSVTILTPVLTDFENQMTTGQADAQQSNAGDVSSAFHAWETNEQDKQNVSNNNEVTNAYNKADNAYYSAHQTAPDALSNWNSDAGNLPGDITKWANAEELVAQDNVTGSSSLSSNQQTAATDLQTYNSDLAKAKADLAQL